MEKGMLLATASCAMLYREEIILVPNESTAGIKDGGVHPDFIKIGDMGESEKGAGYDLVFASSSFCHGV